MLSVLTREAADFSAVETDCLIDTVHTGYVIPLIGSHGEQECLTVILRLLQLCFHGRFQVKIPSPIL